jgi:hypothetical protein
VEFMVSSSLNDRSIAGILHGELASRLTSSYVRSQPSSTTV